MENKSTSAIAEIRLFNIAGKLLEELPVKNTIIVPISDYPAGVYMMQAIFTNGFERIVKIIKQ